MNCRNPSQPQKRSAGFTLIELMFALGIGALMGGALMVLLLETATENYRAVADQAVEQAASELQNQILLRLRAMSMRGGLLYAGPTSQDDAFGSAYRRVIVSRGPAPDFPREELRFDATSQQVLYFTNAAQTNLSAATVLLQSRPNSYRLIETCFYPAVKDDGTPDNSLVNVILVLDDNGSSRPRRTGNRVTVERTFSVRLRND